MGVVENIRNQLQVKVFNRIGSTITLSVKSSPVYNEYGDEEDATYTDSSEISVPYNLIDPMQTNNPFGKLNEGEMDLALPYSAAFSVGDRITLNSKVYEIKQVEDYIMSNISAAYIVRLYKLI